MNRQKKSQSLFLRFLSGGALLTWILALVVCTARCTCDEDCDSAAPKHDDAVAHHHDNNDSDQHPSQDDSFCASLPTIVHNSHQSAFVKPAFPVVSTYDLAIFFPLCLSSAENTSNHEIARQSSRPDFVFTPEVYLGPAFRSLAPPFLA